MQDIPMPWRLVVACAAVGVIAGATVGFVRGLGYPRTLPFAIVEGGILIGFPSCVLGLLVAGCWSIASGLRRRYL